MDCTRICFIEKNFKFDYLAAKDIDIFWLNSIHI